MLTFLRRRTFFSNGIVLGGRTAKRTFLSDAYKCSEAWQKRLLNPAFGKINFQTVHYNLDLNFQENKRVNVLDIDMFLNSMTDYTYKNELENVLLKLRESPECSIVPERTYHAVIRLYLELAPKEDIFNILSNPIHYGVFLDGYLANLLMDKFLKDEDSVSAVKIAALQMLQEDFDHPITKVMALYSCYNYLASPEVWAVQVPESETGSSDDDDEEVKKVRVPYLKNPYFDDHFDIREPNHLVGKTMYLFGASVGDVLGASSQLLGLIIYEKYDKCVTFLEDSIKNNTKFYSEAVSMAKDFLTKKPKQGTQSDAEGKENESKLANEENSPESPKEETKPKEEPENTNKSKIDSLLSKLKKKNLVEGKILLECEKMVKDAIEKNQNKDIAHQCEVYKQWEQDRIKHIEEEIERSQVEKLKAEIAKTKMALEKEEQKLFYFDEEDKLEMIIESNEQKMKNIVYYKAKGKEKESEVETYNPPQVHQNKSNN